MNKILLNSEDDINNLVVEEDTILEMRFISTKKYMNIIIPAGRCLNVLDLSSNSANKILFVLEESARLVYNKFGLDCSDEVDISLDGSYSNVELKHSYISRLGTRCQYNITHNSPSTSSVLHNHGINLLNNEMTFDVDVKINGCGKDVVTNQENKIININSGKSFIKPNLIVDNNEVNASHSAYISDFDDDLLFYMKSRGISKEAAQRLLIKGFLLGNLNINDDYYREIEEMISL